jgi:hypothetical protein
VQVAARLYPAEYPLFSLHNLILANAVPITSEQAGKTKYIFPG